MAYDEGLARRVHAVLSGRDGVVEKKMFGGLAFMIEGNMCCGVIDESLMVRVGPDGYEDALARPHARPMDFTGRAPLPSLPGRGMARTAVNDRSYRPRRSVGHVPGGMKSVVVCGPRKLET